MLAILEVISFTICMGWGKTDKNIIHRVSVITGSELSFGLPKMSFIFKLERQGSYHTNLGTVLVVVGWSGRLESLFCLSSAVGPWVSQST